MQESKWMPNELKVGKTSSAIRHVENILSGTEKQQCTTTIAIIAINHSKHQKESNYIVLKVVKPNMNIIHTSRSYYGENENGNEM
jgi:hypothetical protein